MTTESANRASITSVRLALIRLFPTPEKAVFFFSSRRRHTKWNSDWSSDVCSSDLCSLNGARRCLRYLESKLGIKAGKTTPDGRFTLRGMECLAACDKAPMMYINNAVMHTHLTEDRSEERRVGKECGFWRWMLD